MNELKELGYIAYTKHQNGSGTYYLDDEPKHENPNVEKPNVENPNLGKPPRIKKKQSNKNTNCKNTNVKVTSQVDAEIVSRYLFDKICSVNPNVKSNWESWTSEIEKAIRIDGRTKEQLLDCLNWIYSDSKGSFWIPNILSGKKLREKFDTMNMQVINKPINKTTSAIDEAFARRGYGS